MAPHSPQWFEAMRRLNPDQAAITSRLIEAAGHSDICSICGDEDSRPSRMVDEPGLTVRLCDDCKRIQKDIYGSSFDPVPEKPVAGGE